jgi:hypothetical protein
VEIRCCPATVILIPATGIMALILKTTVMRQTLWEGDQGRESQETSTA